MVAPPDNDVLWASALHVTFNGSPALTGVSLGVREREILAVGGPRGSGKTTLLRCLSGQLLPRNGEVWFNSAPLHTMGPMARERLRRHRFGWIEPEPRLVPELTVWENAALGLMLRGGLRRSARTAAHEWLERLDVGGCARKRPGALTQAERQRVAIARALACAPSVLFADEPTAPLHRADRAHVLRTLTTAARSHGITVVLATHDADVAALADRTVTLLDGRRVHTVRLPEDDLGAAGTELMDTSVDSGIADIPATSGTADVPADSGTADTAAGTGTADTAEAADTAGDTATTGPSGAGTGTPDAATTPGAPDSDTEGRAACSLSV
ncbi:ABC transporter ATP-binding protein [Streptomyces sp. NPDC017941]|uniref:ABC transporter ATP-binding protein n=1 Tax=Streptomyces sp. NPDC017941 TaxID=3365018 RepID=UPI0037A19B27